MGAMDTKPASVFELGSWKTKPLWVKKSASPNPPHPVYIYAPDLEPNEPQTNFPVLLFLHGFMMPPDSYSQLFQHISSHGYIVVAPGHTLLSYIGSMLICSAVEDVDSLAQVADWIKTDLHSFLPSNIQPDTSNVSLAGHSKGGKAAFALALGHAQTTVNFTALIGVDPVAGPGTDSLIAPKILTYIPRTFNMAMPVAVIGTGLGNDTKCCCLPVAAPFGCNHPEFYKSCKPPSCYFLANNYGHMDMLDDGMAWLSSLVLASGKGLGKMRSGVGGIIVAFLMAYDRNNPDRRYLEAIVNSPDIAPIRLDPVLWVEE